MLLDLLFPRRCVGCKREGFWLCSACEAAVADALAFEKVQEGLLAFYPFEQPLIRELLHHLKYNAAHEVPSVLVKLLGFRSAPEQLRSALGTDRAILVPVPVSRARQKERGYNQAELIARALGEWLHWPVQTDLLIKKNGKSLVGRSAAERRQQVGSLFCLSPQAKAPSTDLILVDDVTTTGSTVEVCRSLLADLSGRPVRAIVIAAVS